MASLGLVGSLFLVVFVSLSGGEQINTPDANVCDYGWFVHRMDITTLGKVKMACSRLPDLTCNNKDKKIKKLLANMPVTCQAKWHIKCPTNYYVAGIKPSMDFGRNPRLNYKVFCCTYPPLQGCQKLKTKNKKLTRPKKVVSFARKNKRGKMNFFTRITTAGIGDYRLHYAFLSTCPKVQCKRKKACFND
jgi:hypothetical protein